MADTNNLGSRRLMEAGLFLIYLGILFTIITVTVYLLMAQAFAGNLNIEGAYRAAYDWLVVWNLGSLGFYLMILGGALLVWAFMTDRGIAGRAIGRVTLGGAIVGILGQAIYIVPGSPELTAALALGNDDLFNAIGQAVSLIGAVAFIAGITILFRRSDLFDKNKEGRRFCSR